MILLFFLLCGVAYGTDVHSDCYNHGSKDGSCECLDGYTGNNCELCKRCNYQGTCHGNFKVEGETTDNEGTKECVCDKKTNGKFKWGGAECAVDAVCHSDSDCKRGTCVKNLCDCEITAGDPWSGDTCNIEPTCPSGCFHGTCTMELGTTADTFGLIRAVSSGKNCICNDGYGGVACDQPLVPDCNNKGYLNISACACEEGYGDDCSCDHECAWDNAESRTCPTGLCQCKSGYEQPDCTCKGDQCSGHGACSDSGCDCEEGWVNYQCSGHGECNDCTCHPAFEGEMCNVLKPTTLCLTGEHYMENGIYYEEGGACDVVENRNTFFGREYNLHPLQSIQYEATSWTDCHQKCMDRIDSNVTDESIDISPIKFEDRYGWDGANPSWANNAKIYARWSARRKELKFPYHYYTYLDSEIMGTVADVDSGTYDGSKWHNGNKFSINVDSVDAQYQMVDRPTFNGGTVRESQFTTFTATFSVNKENAARVWENSTAGLCDVSHSTGAATKLCIEGNYPAIPKYYKRMDSFETEYANPTHYAYDNGKCTCFGLGEDTCGTTKDITYDPKRSGDQMTQWDNNQPNSLKEVSSPVQRKPGIISYWKRDGDYCVPCLSGYHNVSGTHCCPNGWEGKDCDININDCQGDPCNDNVHICVDDADAAEYNKNLSIGNYACVCKPGKTGTFNISTGLETCDKECCIDGENVTAHGGFTDSLTVHGTCKSGVGGCDCDYGYEGPKCECTDSMCDHGYCNVGGNTFCKCHPGYELDDTGKCTVGADLCADSPCVNHDTDDTELPICTNTENDYHCKCEVGYIGKNCTIDTEWNIGNTTCDGYLLNGRCVDCPHGTYSRGPTDTTCRIILTDENIHDAVSGTSDLYGDIATFDTSAVTNMDRLFKDKTVPDISNWVVSSVTSMREMFMGTTKPDTSKWTFHPDVDKFWWERNPVIYSQLTCAKVVNGRCQFTNGGLRNIVLAWENAEAGTEDVYGPLATWDVSYVTNMTDLFQNSTKNPDITNWDMSNVVHADRMLLNSGFTQRIDNKDLSSLQTANDMMPTNYATNGGRLCGKHFLRVCEALVRKYTALGDTDALKDIDCANRVGFNGMGFCLTSTVPEGQSVSVIKQAVEHWYDTDKRADIITKHGEMSEWDVSQVQSMYSLFLDKNGIPPLTKWDTSSVTDMESMFENSDFNEDIRHWDVRKVDNFNFMFKGNTDFAVDLTFWEIHASEHDDTFSGNTHYDVLMFKIGTTLPERLTDATFHPAVNDWFDADKKADIIAEYGEISDWLVYEVTDMSNAFEGRTTFNEDISSWNVGAVTDMSSMFEGSAFNSPIDKWNVDKVRDMSSMFKGSSFNQLIDRWNVSSVEDMSSMFENSVFSRPIGDWDLWGTYWNETQSPGDGNSKCFAEEGMIITLDPNTRQNLQSNYRICFDECTGTYPNRLDDIEGRTRSRGGGEVGSHYTPYMAGFGFVENASLAYTCQCATKIDNCVSSPFDRVLEYRDMKTDDMFTGNDKFIQPLCGIGWRYRDIRSLSPPQRGVSLTCDICNTGEHMSTCGLCLGEFRFDHCLDSPMAFTLKELHDFGESHGMTGLVVNAGGIPLDEYALDDDINNGYVNPYACNCEYEEGMKGCLVVNGRKQVRMKEWYADGLTDFSTKTITQYYCELDFLDGRDVASAEGFNSVECTEDTLLNQIECGLVGGNWNGKCDKCLKPCDPPELGVKFISTNRKCEECAEGMTVWNNECVLCPDGKFTDENRAWCGKCPSGTYGADGDCFSCAQGAASTFEGALQCSTCSAGTFSVGTKCQDCPTGKSSKNGAWSCYDVALCRHGKTTVKPIAGNWCDLCNDGFKLNEVGTCVADCVHGGFTVNTDGSGTCQCTDMWGQTLGKPWNDCDYCDPKYVHIGKTCHDTPCDATLFTDCVCGVSPVIDGELCFNNKPYSECSVDQTGCLCNTGDSYEHVVSGFRCIDSQVVELCGDNAISEKDVCSDLKIGNECLEKCAHGGQIVDSATHVVLDSNILPLCGGTKKTDCYGVPWKEMDYNCGAHVQCDVNEAVNTSVTYNGMGNEDASSCCKKKQQCMDFTCPSTYADRVGEYVLTRTEYGMCNGGEWYTRNAELYETAAQALQRCGLFTGESIIAHLDDKVFVCTQGFSNETANSAPTLQHQEDCDTWYYSLRFNGTYRTATTYTYQRSKPQDTYSTGLVFTTGEGDATCCTEVCDGKHTCTRPIYGVCDGVCTDADFLFDGDQPSTCCEADSWYCDSTCNVGFTNSGAYCGEKCDTTHFAATSITQNVPVELSGVEVVCNKTLETASTKEGCSSACSGYFQMDGGKCYCTDTGPCKSDTAADCSDWCDGSLQRAGKQFGYGEYNTYTVCRDLKSSASCPSGWFSDSRWDNACAYGSLGDPNSQACYDSNNCCEVSHITYQMRTLPERTESVCCDIDTAYQACASLDCPDRHTNKTIYGTGFYSTNHTTECCEPISETHYCDTQSDFECLDYERLSAVNYCGDICTKDKCCKPNNYFCDNFTCHDGFAKSGEIQCDVECVNGKCCLPKPSCNSNHACHDPSSHMLDSNYKCSEITGGACAASEYEGNYNCCILKDTCATAQDRLGTQCYNSNWDNWDNVQSVQLTRSTFFETCCKSTCQQLQYEKAAGDRGHDLCDNSLNGEDVNVDLTDPKDIVDKCCENSCGKKAISNDWSCPAGSFRNSDYWSNIGWNTEYTQTSFASNCCHMSCDSVNGTQTCGTGKVENIQTYWYQAWGNGDDVQDSDWYMARDAISDFDSSCCVEATCNNIVLQQNFKGRTCEAAYGRSYDYGSGNIALTDHSDPLACCKGLADPCREQIGLGSRCIYPISYLDWISSSTEVTAENFVNKCCSTPSHLCMPSFDAGSRCPDDMRYRQWVSSSITVTSDNFVNECCWRA